jgi:hypothetical protein
MRSIGNPGVNPEGACLYSATQNPYPADIVNYVSEHDGAPR